MGRFAYLSVPIGDRGICLLCWKIMGAEFCLPTSYVRLLLGGVRSNCSPLKNSQFAYKDKSFP